MGSQRFIPQLSEFLIGEEEGTVVKMGLKSIEMQVALPRTQDVGKIQEQMDRQGQLLQGALLQSQLEKEKIKRTQIQQSEKSSPTKNKKESDKGQQKQKSPNKVRSDHPYLGKRIDFNG